MPAREDVGRRRLAEHEAFEQRIGRQPVGPVQPALGAFPNGIEARQVGMSGKIDHHPAAGVMLRGHHRDRLPGHVDTKREQLFVDRREMGPHEIGGLVADVEVDVIETIALDLDGRWRGRRHRAGQVPAARRTWS
jgi:hypothetical protein